MFYAKILSRGEKMEFEIYDGLVIEKAFEILQKKMLVVPNRVCGIHMFANKDKKTPSSRKLNLCMPLSATKNKSLSLYRNIPHEIKIEFDDEDKRFYNLDFAVNKTSGKIELINVHLPMDIEGAMIRHIFKYEDVMKSIARDLHENFCVKYEKTHPYGKKKMVEKMSVSEYKELQAEEKIKNQEFLKFLNEFDALEICFEEGTKEPLFCEYKMKGYEPGVLYQSYKVALAKLPTACEEDREIKEKVFKKIAKEERKVKASQRKENSDRQM